MCILRILFYFYSHRDYENHFHLPAAPPPYEPGSHPRQLYAVCLPQHQDPLHCLSRRILPQVRHLLLLLVLLCSRMPTQNSPPNHCSSTLRTPSIKNPAATQSQPLPALEFVKLQANRQVGQMYGLLRQLQAG